LGAKAFVDQNPWARDVGLVLNFEARGNAGPAIMFETSSENGGLIREFARAAPAPVTNSLTYDIYKLIPNDTDLTVFKTAGFQGLNFAFIEGLTHYHTLLDSVPNIDERSVQHQGSYALSLTRHFGNMDLPLPREKNSVYFSFGPVFIRYSQAWVIPLTLLAILLFSGVVALGFKRGQLQVSGIGLGFLAFFLCALASSLAVYLLWWVLNGLFGSSRAIPYGDTYSRGWYLAIFLTLTFAITTAVFLWFRKKASTPNLMVGATLWWLLLLVISSLFLRGGTYLLLWPLLFVLLGLALILKDGTQGSWQRSAIVFLSGAPAVVLLAPAIYFIFSALNISRAGIVMILAVMLFTIFLPLLDLLPEPVRWLVPIASVVVCLGGLIGTVVMGSTADGSHPRQDHLFYHLDADKQQASWLSTDQRPDSWTSQFFQANAHPGATSDIPLVVGRRLLKAEAPIAALKAPTIEVLDDQTSGDVRSLRLRVISPRQAPIIFLQLDPGTEVMGAEINGTRINDTGPRTQWGLRYFGVSPLGFELTLSLKSSQVVKIRVIDQSYGLPELPGTPLKPRPKGIIPAPFLYSDLTLVDKLLNL
jgi:hypothetical protein